MYFASSGSGPLDGFSSALECRRMVARRALRRLPKTTVRNADAEDAPAESVIGREVGATRRLNQRAERSRPPAKEYAGAREMGLSDHSENTTTPIVKTASAVARANKPANSR
jgi:hypothetical protein